MKNVLDRSQRRVGRGEPFRDQEDQDRPPEKRGSEQYDGDFGVRFHTERPR
jgi:hypothetical protein